MGLGSKSLWIVTGEFTEQVIVHTLLFMALISILALKVISSNIKHGLKESIINMHVIGKCKHYDK